MLTDYHVHLRPDEPDTPAGALLHRRERRALPGGRRRRRDRRARHLRAHPPLPPGARRLAPSLLGRAGPRRPRRLLRVPRRRRRCASGSRPTTSPAPRTRIGELLAGRRFDYVVGSVHFIGDGAVDHDGYDVWEIEGEDAESVWTPLLRPPRATPPARASSTSSPTPTWSRSGARTGRPRRATCGASTSPRSRRSPSPASPSRSRPRGCASRSARSTRRAASPSSASRPASPFALSSDAHLPEHLGYAYDAGGRVHALARDRARSASSRAASAGWSRSDERARRDRLRQPPPRSRAAR